MPLGHHELIAADEDGGDSAVRVRFHGGTGYARRGDVRVFHYISPELDGGTDRDETIAQEVRDVAVAHAGGSWPADTREAVREGRVLSGMTREQVELAWGWPRTIESLSNPIGGERWVYRRRGYELYCGGASDSAWRFRPAAGHVDGAFYGHSSYDRIPLVEERIVEFNSQHLVVRSFVRRYHDADGADDTP
jgi:hypothetical protein